MSPDPGPPPPDTPPTPPGSPLTVTPTLVTTVALAAAQLTATGREIHRLSNLGGLLHIAYGDYNANTGPIHLLVLDPADDTLTDEATLHTEETWTYRAFSGTRYVAYMDPQGGDADSANGQYASNDGSGWTVHTNVTPVPVHVMDLVVTADGVFLFGAANTPDPPNGGGTVWHSSDNGTTWDVSLAPRPDPTNNARFYAATQVGPDLFTVLDDGDGGWHVYRRSGGVWTQPESLSAPVSGLVPFAIDGVDFALAIPEAKQNGISQVGETGVLTAIEHAASRPELLATLPPTVRDVAVDGGYLYVIDGDFTLWRVDDAGTKTALFTSAVPVCSLAISGTHAYFGTTDSKVYKVPLPA